MKIHTLVLTAVTLLTFPTIRAADQTADFTPIKLKNKLPYTITLAPYDMGSAKVPTLQGMAKAQLGSEWILVSGRTNGLHDFSNDGLKNFPPAEQNHAIWVIDPDSKQTWKRDLRDVSSGLSTAQIDSLTTTAPQAAQKGSTLYIVGGYGYDTAKAAFQTYPTLSALDLPKIVSWVKTGKPTLASSIRQTRDEFLRVTGGELFLLGGKAQLVFGQNFTGGYTPGTNGEYTKQVRTFQINNSQAGLSISKSTAEAPRYGYRRRDLNVVPFMQSRKNGYETGLIALSGVFTPSSGIWTVPVEIASNGSTYMAQPKAASTFRQGMNSYRSGVISLYSVSRDQTENLLFGGISVQYFDPATGGISSDPNVPFINGITAVVRDSSGSYSQTYLGEFPTIPNPANGNAPFLFGAESDFFPRPGIKNFGNGILNIDAISGSTTVGFIYGGIIADQPNDGTTAASNKIFAVTIQPIHPPFLQVSGKKEIRTGAASLIFKGNSSNAVSVQWRVNSNSWRTLRVSANGKWKFKVHPLRHGKNRVLIRAVNSIGSKTDKQKRIIIRK